MFRITTHEELNTLNEVLPHLLFKGKFSISYIHENDIIIPAHTDADGKINIDTVGRLTHTLHANGVYKNISRFLQEYGFAANDDGLLSLTITGEYLCAHGSLDTYNSFLKMQLADNELIKRLELLLQEITPYGEFSIGANPRPNKLAALPQIPILIENENADVVKKLAEERRRISVEVILEEHANIIKDERVVEYMVHQGFAINRYDIKHDKAIYRQLTDNGRKLKELGSIEKYNLHLLREAAEVDRRKKRDGNLYWINFWIAVGAVSAAIYYWNQFLLSVIPDSWRYDKPATVIFWTILGPLIILVSTALILWVVRALKSRRLKAKLTQKEG